MSLICGPILIVAGFLFILTPGPSYIIIALGMWLLVGEFLARIFDKVGVRLGRVRQRITDLWRASHVVVKVMIVCTLAILLIHTVYSLFYG